MLTRQEIGGLFLCYNNDMTSDEVKKLAVLARVGIDDAEAESLVSEFDAILGYVGEINAVQAGEAVPVAGDLINVMREDENPHEAGVFTEDILNEAPSREGDYIKVKKIL